MLDHSLIGSYLYCNVCKDKLLSIFQGVELLKKTPGSSHIPAKQGNHLCQTKWR